MYPESICKSTLEHEFIMFVKKLFGIIYFNEFISRVRYCCYKHFYEAFGYSDTGLVTCILEFGLLNIFYNSTFISVCTRRKIVGKMTIFIVTMGETQIFMKITSIYSKNCCSTLTTPSENFHVDSHIVFTFCIFKGTHSIPICMQVF